MKPPVERNKKQIKLFTNGGVKWCVDGTNQVVSSTYIDFTPFEPMWHVRHPSHANKI